MGSISSESFGAVMGFEYDEWSARLCGILEFLFLLLANILYIFLYFARVRFRCVSVYEDIIGVSLIFE